MKRAHLIVVGNAKGGSGKSTTAMHVTTRLLAQGHRVGAIDLDGQQQTLGRYMENRALFCERRGIILPMPELKVLVERQFGTREQAEQDIYTRLTSALASMSERLDCIVLDCPGSDSFLSRLGHTFADTLLTPVNDSFIDLDLLARIDPESFRILRPSWYSEMVWEIRKRRFVEDGHTLDWIVMRNRMSHIDARNKRRVGEVLTKLAPRFKFRAAPGFGERVIFRELFLKGLTLSDLKGRRLGVEVTMNHVAAHQEIKALVGLLNIAGGDAAANPIRTRPRRPRVAQAC